MKAASFFIFMALAFVACDGGTHPVFTEPSQPRPQARSEYVPGAMIDSTMLEREKERAVLEAFRLWARKEDSLRQLLRHKRLMYGTLPADTVRYPETDSLAAADAERLMATIQTLIEENDRLKDLVAVFRLDSMRYLLPSGDTLIYDADVAHFIRSGEMNLDLRLYSRPQTHIAVIPEPTWLDWAKDAGLLTAVVYAVTDIALAIINKK